MSLLTIAQAIAPRVGIGTILAVTSSSDLNVAQLWAAINESGQELAARYAWQAIVKEANFSTVATTVQGTIQTLVGADFNYVLNETMWDRTTRRPVFGPRSSSEWQAILAQFVNGPWWQYRIRGNQVLFTPTPAAGDQIYFEYVSKFWAGAIAGISTYNQFTNDSDMTVLDERLIQLDARWRYKHTKGLDYSEDFDIAEAAIIEAMSRDGAKPILSTAMRRDSIQPGIWVQAGNFPGKAI